MGNLHGSSAASASFRPAYKIEFLLGGKKRKTGMHFVEMGRFRRENQGVLRCLAALPLGN